MALFCLAGKHYVKFENSSLHVSEYCLQSILPYVLSENFFFKYFIFIYYNVRRRQSYAVVELQDNKIIARICLALERRFVDLSYARQMHVS